jgi:hypothetical protein
MKKQYIAVIIVLIIILAILTFYIINNPIIKYDSTVSKLGFSSPVDYKDTPAKLICQDSECIENFPVGSFDNCNLLWNSTYESPSAVGYPVYYFTGIYDCKDKKYIYYSKTPPTKINIAEIK